MTSKCLLLLCAAALGLSFVTGDVAGQGAAKKQPDVNKALAQLNENQIKQIEIAGARLVPSAREIVERRPEALPQLVNDAKVIAAQREEVWAKWTDYKFDQNTKNLPIGHVGGDGKLLPDSKEEAFTKAEAYIWKELRLSALRPDEELKPDRWGIETSRRGRVAVISVPESAQILVDGQYQAHSNWFIFPAIGERRICLMLNGYQEYCETRQVKNGTDNDDLNVKLQPRQ